jgi:hypothetical protein
MATPTSTAHSEKITHALSVLGAAGMDDSNKAATTPGTATTTHAEKITHAVNALSNAGLSDSSSNSSSSLGDKKWIIIGASVGGAVLLAILILLFFFLRGRRRRRHSAYANVGRGVDMKETDKGPGGSNPALGAAPQPGMRGFLMPAWRSKGKGKGNATEPLGAQGEAALRGPSMDLDLSSRGPSFDATYTSRGRSLSAVGSRSREPSADYSTARGYSRSRSRGPRLSLDNGSRGVDNGSRDVFNAEKEMMPSESDSMLVGGGKIAERNFESGYDSMDTSYPSAAVGGDKRSAYGA